MRANVLATDTSSGTATNGASARLTCDQPTGEWAVRAWRAQGHAWAWKQEFEHRICAVRGIDQDFASRMQSTRKRTGGGNQDLIPISTLSPGPVS